MEMHIVPIKYFGSAFTNKIRQINKHIIPLTTLILISRLLLGTNCAPLVADLYLFCYEIDFMLSLSDNNQTDIIVAFNSTSRY